MESKQDRRKQKERINVLELDVRSIDVASTIKGQNVKIFLNSINNLRFTQNTEIQFTEHGIKFISEESPSFQAVGYFFSSFFERFHFMKKKTVPVHSFGINLNAFADFFSALIDNNLTLMKIIYYGKYKSLAFVLSQFDSVDNLNETANASMSIQDTVAGNGGSEIATEYIIKTKSSINPIDFNAIDSNKLSKISFSPNDFNEIIQDLDRGNTEELLIKVTASKVVFKSIGVTLCNVQIPFAPDHKIIKTFEHFEDSKYRYKFLCFKQVLKSLQLAAQVCLETKENGLLRIMLLGKADDSDALFMEFNIVPDVDDDESVIQDE